MKLSVSLSEEDVAALDAYARQAGVVSRSAALHDAIRRLPDVALQDAYAQAWDEWVVSPDAQAWEATTADGLGDAAR